MQNRVNPFGNIISTKARGSWMGNRGKIHNDNKEIKHAFKLKAWLICKLEFNGRKRIVMGLKTYTELFFFDEATAFAAGHRPCFECRREDYKRFKAIWIKANPQYNFNIHTSIQKIDEVLHSERINSDGLKKTYTENISSLPDGTFIAVDDKAFLLNNKKMYLWTPYGYKKPLSININKKVVVLTPQTIVNTFQAGYLAQMSL